MNHFLCYIFLFLVVFVGGQPLKAQDAIINEWSQGRNGTTAEWVEILIVKDNLSLKGWSLWDDNPSQLLFQFSNDFPALPAGTLLLVYMTPDQCRCTYPDDYASNMPDNTIRTCNYTFNPQEREYVNVARTIWSNGNNSSNTITNDNYILKDATNNIVHDWDHGNNAAFTVSPPRPMAGQATYYNGNSVAGINVAGNWRLAAWNSGLLTPGQPNGGANTTLINNLKANASAAAKFVSRNPITKPENTSTTIEILICPANKDGIVDVDIDVLGANITAVYGSDFITIPAAVNGIVSIPVKIGDEKVSFVVQTLRDCENESDEFFIIRNSGGSFAFDDSDEIRFTITDVPVPQDQLKVISTPPSPLCKGQTATLKVVQADGSDLPDPSVYTYDWSPPTDLSASDVYNPTFTADQTRTYTVTVKDKSGVCDPVAPNPITMTVFDQPSVVIEPIRINYCEGEQISLTAKVTPANGNYGYSWNGGTTNTTLTETLNTIGNKTYSVTVTAGGSCSATAELSITVSPKPSFNYDPQSATICVNDAGTDVTFTDFPVGTQFSFSPPETADLTDNGIDKKVYRLHPTSTTIYSVVARDPNSNCDSDPVSIRINVSNTDPVILANPSKAEYCRGETITSLKVINRNGNFPVGTTFLWSPSGATTDEIKDIILTKDTVYSVLVTDPAGCNPTATIILNVNPVPEFDKIIDRITVCKNQGFTEETLQVKLVGTTVVWNPPADVVTVDPVKYIYRFQPSTSKVITGTFSYNGCDTTILIQVDVVDGLEPIVNNGQNINICSKQTEGIITTVDLTQGSKEGVSFTWSPPDGLTLNPQGDHAIITPPATPTITYTIIATKGTCTGKTEVTVLKNESPDVQTIVPDPLAVCIGGTVKLGASCTNCNLLEWKSFRNKDFTSNEPYPTTDPLNIAGVDTFTVIGYTPEGCIDSAKVTVTVHPAPEVTLNPNISICLGAKLTITAQANNIREYAWAGPNSFSQAGTSSSIEIPDMTVDKAGIYTLTITDNNGCTNSAQTMVSIAENLTVNIDVANAGKVCEGATLTLQSNPANFAVYEWTLPDNTKNTTAGATLTIDNVSNNHAGKYQLFVKDASGCSGTAEVTITVNAKPTIPAANTTAKQICAGKILTIDLGGDGYTWNPNNSVKDLGGNRFELNPASTQTYTLTRTNADGCTQTATTTVTVNPLPNITRIKNETGCKDQTFTLAVSGADSYEWDATDITPLTKNDTLIFTPNEVKNYTFTVTGTNSATGCTNTASITVTINELPTILEVKAGRATITEGDTTLLSVTESNGTVIEWEPKTDVQTTGDIKKVIVTPKSTTTYTATAIKDGCRNTQSVTVNVEKYKFEVGGVFTPNGDGYNDVLTYFFDNNNVTNFQIQIFDRWGMKVFESTNITEFWNGKVNNTGDNVPEGTYFYTIKLTRSDEAKLEKSQSVTLIR